MSTYDQAYHPPNCTCDLPPGPISVQEFLRSCFYPRMLANNENREERIFGGLFYSVPQPYRRDFLGKEYKNTDIWNNEPRHPLLCLDGHYTWEPGEEKTPSSFTVNTGGITMSTLKNMIKNGDYIAGAHFKHHHGEKDNCHCGMGRSAAEILLAEQRKAALSRRVNGTPILQDYDGAYELKFYVQNGSDALGAGIHNTGDSKIPSMLHPSDLENVTSIWLQSRDVGALPGNCAGFLCYENTDDKPNLFIPDVGKIVLIIPNSRKLDYITYLRGLKEKIPDGVKMVRGKAKSLHQLTEYRQGIIQWSDEKGQELVKQFLQKITGIESHMVRSTRPLLVEVYDRDYEMITPVSKHQLSDFGLDAGQQFFIKIRRMRNTPLDGFRLLLGPGISASHLNLRGLEASNLGVDHLSGGTLWKIFVREKDLQVGLWAKLEIQTHSQGVWIEVFDHGSTVEQSGTRLQIVPTELI